MDALAASNPSGFQHLVSHISLFHNPMSNGYSSMVSKVLHDDVKLRNVERVTAAGPNGRCGKFMLWDVPGMGAQLGKVMPFDIYGQHVLIDEKELASPDKRVTHGTLRYAIAAAGVRRREGGRRVYDYATMNFALACGAILGSAVLYHSRRRFTWLQKRPGWSIALSLGVCAATIPVVRSLFKIFAVGITIAERQHAKALKVTGDCYDCLCDIYEFTDTAMIDTKQARLPAPKPGMPPVTPEQAKAFASAMEIQSLLLGRDLTQIRSLLKQMLQRSGQLITSTEYNAGDDGGPDGSQYSDASASFSEKKTPSKKLLKAEHETTLSHTEEAALLVNARRVPESVLCEVHRGLRRNPDTFVHEHGFPVFPSDRQLAKSRPAMLEGK